MAFESGVDKEDVLVAADTLSFLSRIHGFGVTPMGKRLETGLKVLEFAGYAETATRDPRLAISEAVQGTLMNGLNINPVLYGLNIAGDVSAAILPSLRDTAEHLRLKNSELYDEYMEAKGIFELLALYHTGLDILVSAVGDGVADFAADTCRFFETAVRKGVESGTLSAVVDKVDEARLKEIPVLGGQLGMALRAHEGLRPLHAGMMSSVSVFKPSLSAGTPVAVGRIGAMSRAPTIGPDVTLRVFGSSSAGFGAVVSVSLASGPGAFVVAGVAAVGMLVTSIFAKKRRKKLKKKKEKLDDKLNAIRQFVEGVPDRIDALLKATNSSDEKIRVLEAMIAEFNEYTRHKGVISSLDHYFGADAMRETGDQIRAVLNNIARDISAKIIPALKANDVFVRAIREIDDNDFATASARTIGVSLMTTPQREFCQAYIALKQGDISAVARLEALRATECNGVVEQLLAQLGRGASFGVLPFAVHAGAAAGGGAGGAAAAGGAGVALGR